MKEYQVFILKDMDREGKDARAALIGSMFSGEISDGTSARGHWQRSRVRWIFARRGKAVDLDSPWYYGLVNMIAAKNGRVKPSKWQGIYLKWMQVEFLPDEKYEVD
jgi:hypothetical protein